MTSPARKAMPLGGEVMVCRGGLPAAIPIAAEIEVDVPSETSSDAVYDQRCE